ncbi:spore germination protein [Paenibacillus sp. HWE-109]|uniref:GerAB/ArcD/ProY family transporter n=1 Tax=Paenibacillus sp. HWE-109 TaxID=1306526 RepID=UPI001EDF23E7|nr:endospore germination permease [Paenibacillus sp. HWE-109]UKS28744.1 spore germination protein [Paenibacillus sp. HWE-109]
MLSPNLTTKQTLLLLCFSVYGTLFFTLPRNLTQAAGHNGWLSILIGSLLVIPIIWLISEVGSSMQEKSIIAYCLSLFGPVFGRLFALLLLGPLLLFSAITVRIITELFVTLILPETPLELIVVMMLILRYYLAHGGILSIARWSEVILPGIAVLMLILFVLSLENVEFQRMLPLFNASMLDTLKGSLGICSAFSEMTLVLFIYPHVKNKSKMIHTMVWTIIIVTFSFEIVFLVTLGTYGSAFTQRLTFPVMELIKDIAIFEFIEHLESPFLALWIFLNLTKGTFTFYCCCTGFQDWFGTSHFRGLMIPISVIIFYLSLIPDNVYNAIVEYEIAKGAVFCFYALLLLTILWLAGKLKARRSAHEENR